LVDVQDGRRTRRFAITADPSVEAPNDETPRRVSSRSRRRVRVTDRRS